MSDCENLNRENLIISKHTSAGQELIIACDGKCEKAWGVNARPFIGLDKDDTDDIVWLSDSELGVAPIDPGTREGGDSKPIQPKHNKWCFRECERSDSCNAQEFPNLKLPDFSRRLYNQPCKHEGGSTDEQKP